MVERVIATEGALALIRHLQRELGPIALRQDADRADANAVRVCALSGFTAGAADLMLGSIDGCPVYIDRDRHADWHYTQLIIDVTRPAVLAAFQRTGQGPDISLQALTRRLSTEEWASLSTTRPTQDHSPWGTMSLTRPRVRMASHAQ